MIVASLCFLPLLFALHRFWYDVEVLPNATGYTFVNVNDTVRIVRPT